jgi:hypothetical protein
LIERWYSIGFNNSNDGKDLELIKLIIHSKGIITRGNKTIITTFEMLFNKFNCSNLFKI